MAEAVKFLSSRFLSASTLVGAKVRNPENESLGELKDCMIDATSGKIAYGVLSFSGFLGMGHKLFAIPWNNFRVDAETERLIVDLTRERLKDAPGFDENHWPNFADPTFTDEIGKHYGTRSGAAEPAAHAAEPQAERRIIPPN